MKAHIKLFLLSSLLALSACADEFRLGDPMQGGRVWCGDVHTADAPWKAGCATQHNLAMLAEKPDDLILPRPEAPHRSMSGGRIFDSYGQSPRPGLRPAQTRTAAGSPSQTVAEETP